MTQIFVSYSRADTAAVDHLIAKMQSSGLAVWVDRAGIRGGAQWRQEIVKAIHSCDAFVIVLSPNSIASVNVRKELDLADGRRKLILPVMLQRVKIPEEMEYQLAGVQTIDLAANFEKGFDNLLKAVHEKRATEPVERPRSSSNEFFQPATMPQFSRYDLLLTKAGAYKTNVARTLSQLTDLSAGEAAEMIENIPATILSGVPQDAALRVKEALESQGASVLLQSPVTTARAGFDLIMTGSGAYKINVARSIKELTNLSQEEAEELLAHLPATILTGVSEEAAKAARRTLEAQGASVKVSTPRSS